MILDAPLGKWLRVTEPKTFADRVENSVRIIPLRGRERQVYVTIPTEFYILLTQLEKPERLKENKVSFYLEEYGKRWIFGYFIAEEAVDLWFYTPSTLPGWAR